MLRLLIILGLAFSAGVQTGLRPDPAIACSACDEWNRPVEPRRVFGNTYSVGVAGLSVVLITSDDGHILLDGALPQSAPIVDRHIRQLGFRTADIRLILNSHTHYDHAGGIAALQRASGAEVRASPDSARALARGGPVPDDPQFAADGRFPRVPDVRIVPDGETLRVGPLEVTAHFTPGHTPGGTTWTWRACEGTDCRHIVYADSLNAVSAPGFRFSDGATHPGLVPAFRRSIERVARLPCDILIAVHPSFAEGRTCASYAEDAMSRLERRVAEESR